MNETRNMDDSSNSEELGGNDEQTEGTQESSQQAEQTGGSDSASEGFTQIDRESLSPEMAQQHDSMNSDYTQAKQRLAEQQRLLDGRVSYADLGEMVAQNSEINRLVFDASERIRNNQPVGELPALSQQEAQPSSVSDNIPEEEVLVRKMMREEIAGTLREILPTMLEPLTKVTNYVQQSRDGTEYDLLLNKYPNAKSVSLMQLQNQQMQFKRADDSRITMEDAFGMLALKDPSLLNTQPGQPPSAIVGNNGANRPVVEKGTQKVIVRTLIPPGGILKSLKAAASKLIKEGGSTLVEATERGKQRYDLEHPESQ